jgi:hypothetical protein
VEPTGLQKLALQSPFMFIFRSGPIPVIYYFPLRPQQVSIELPSRSMVHQTLDSNFLDFFPGPRSVLARVQLRGTFGYDTKFGGIGIPMPGGMHLRTLQALYETFNALSREVHEKLRTRTEYTVPGQGYYWRVHIESIQTRIANNDPLLFYYELSFIRLTDYLSMTGGNFMDLIQSFTPAPIVSSALGNLFGSLPSLSSIF